MPYYREEKPDKLEWQSAVTADASRLKSTINELLDDLVLGDLKRDIVRDFHEIGYRNGMYGEEARDRAIALYLKFPEEKNLTFSRALEWLEQIALARGEPRTAKNITLLKEALRTALLYPDPLHRSVGEFKEHGRIGDVLSMGEEIFSMVKPLFNEPEVKVQLQDYCLKLEAIAGQADRLRRAGRQR